MTSISQQQIPSSFHQKVSSELNSPRNELWYQEIHFCWDFVLKDLHQSVHDLWKWHDLERKFHELQVTYPRKLKWTLTFYKWFHCFIIHYLIGIIVCERSCIIFREQQNISIWLITWTTKLAVARRIIFSAILHLTFSKASNKSEC